MTDPLKRVAVIGAGPAGLMAAEVVSNHGYGVDVYDVMPSVARKFLMAGKSGLNITNMYFPDDIGGVYPQPAAQLRAALGAFSSQAVESWMLDLGIQPVTGSTGRVFPKQMKASPLLRAWLRRLQESGVRSYVRHRLRAWDKRGLQFDTPDGQKTVQPAACVFAMGGSSWARLGSDGQWAQIFREAGIELSPFLPSNCGFCVSWSDRMKNEFAGHPVKNVQLTVKSRQGVQQTREEFVVTADGVESGAIYTLSLTLRDMLVSGEVATIWLDLLPDLDVTEIKERLLSRKGKQSVANHLRRTLNLTGVKRALLNELGDRTVFDDPQALAQQIKTLPLTLGSMAPLDQAISTAGGVSWDELTEDFMLRKKPGFFCAGEMVDWDAPTGGYLLTACFATGQAAGLGAVRWLENRSG
ncbi:TIGR03862 family flavoprotein [Hyphomonas pacifica]|uniref:NAD(FAD)-utilizing dehydrogenase n=1 Tax=Hyphomonas pacifica TaxID=1280941 RepID=A0A062TWA5_9PROT|nr:TIGR03862 family flavoprotein [Hyphomonas pacifica]KCZ50322.1 hypothetical protein HY2_14330 [Hyphomonas pacifica]RAN32595.1 hypothetical protein HY3_14810 [Hyphomonas pacifica]RAN36274.1 hypothetical protein HY11_11950 [Hyphomonas pacifica]